MITEDPIAPTRGRRPASDTLLLVTPEVGEAHMELARRLLSVADTRACPLGVDTRPDLASVLLDEPPHVVAVPLSLSSRDPLLVDLTGLLRWATARWPASNFLQSAPLGTSEHVIGWASLQARVALGHVPQQIPLVDAGLLIVGPGDSIPAVNAHVCAIARMLAETRDYELVEVAFARDARPTIREGICRLFRLGARWIVVLPLTFFADATYQAVRAQVQAANEPGVTLARPLLTPEAAAAIVRRRYDDALGRWAASGDDGFSHAHRHDLVDDPLEGGDHILPPRYRAGRAVSPSSMGSASLTYDAEGRVAWDRVWRGFCHLALAGGPPHRGKLLEPPSKDEVIADQDASARVAAEIARGLFLITRLPTVTNAAPGWVGLVCSDDEMAVWLLRAIIVENVSVRREGATLFLPAGPSYRIEKEIKNVITAVAKTYHYWTEHRGGR